MLKDGRATVLLTLVRSDFFFSFLLMTGIQIGPYILHFFNDGLVHFTSLKSRSPLLAITLGEIYYDKDNGKKRIETLCELIANYNTVRKYDTYRCNCHMFVDDALKALEFSASVERYVSLIF